MDEIRMIKNKIKKILPVYDNRMAYKAESICPLLKDCKDDFLLENFSKWSEQEGFLTGLYNILRFGFSSIEELKEHFEKIEYAYRFDKTYYQEGDKFYAEKNRSKDGSCWDNCIISVFSFDEIKNKNRDDFIALSRLKEYELENPNQVVWLGFLNNSDKNTSKWLYKNKLAFKPVKEEKDYLC